MKHLLVDVGRVLILPVPGRKVTTRQKKILKLITEYRDALETGKINYENALKLINEYQTEIVLPFKKIYPSEYYNTLNKHSMYNIELVDYIKTIDAKNHVATNSFEYFINRLVEEYKLNEWTDKILVSDAFKAKKPDIIYFQKAMKTINAKPADCFLIDDKKENVESFMKLGGNGIIYENNEKTFEVIEGWIK